LTATDIGSFSMIRRRFLSSSWSHPMRRGIAIPAIVTLIGAFSRDRFARRALAGFPTASRHADGRSRTSSSRSPSVDRKVMIPMRDGVRIAADIYYPKGGKKYPGIWVRTPYNFNYWDVQNGVPRDMTAALTAIKRGYAYIDMQERGHFFSEGNYDILGPPLTDGDDELNYLRARTWSNGKIGTTGCSSTAEWQGAVAALGNPGYAAFNVQGFGAGVGRVGPYYEQGNWYRGGAVQMLFIDWLYGEQNQVRPMIPRGRRRQI
jgi:predicted acyl esterase